MPTIAFVCNWGNTPAELLRFLARQTPGGSGSWNALRGIAAEREADYLVVLEDLPGGLKRSGIDLSRTIFLPREPKAVRRRKDYEAFRAPFGYTHDDIHQAAVWRIMRPFEELEAQDYFAKERPLSSVTSAAAQTAGHKVRIRFLRDFASRHPGLADVYGYGWKDDLGGSYKGELGDRFAKITDFAALCKLRGLQDYRYALAFENSLQRNYFSEKLVDCWLAWTMPIYWGCPNLADFFPEGSFHAIDPASSDCVAHVAEIVSRPIGERERSAMREARRLVLRRYNVWATVEDIIAGRIAAPVRRPSLIRRLVAGLKGVEQP